MKFWDKPWFTLSAMFLLALVMVPALVFADGLTPTASTALPVSYTAGVLGNLGTLNLASIWALLLSVVAALAASEPLQAMIEGFIAKLLPAPLFFVKPFLPSAIASALGGLAIHLGVSTEDAIAGGIALSKATHWVNRQDWAVDLEKKDPAVTVAVEKVVAGLPSGAASALLMICFLGIAAHASAAWMAGPGAFLEPSLATISKSDSSLQSLTDAIGGAQYTFYTGSYVATTGTGQVQYNFDANWYAGIDGGMDTEATPAGGSNEYVYVGLTEGYSAAGLSEGWRVGGPGGGMFLLGIQAHLSLLQYLPGLDIGNPPSAMTVEMQAEAARDHTLEPISWQQRVTLVQPFKI